MSTCMEYTNKNKYKAFMAFKILNKAQKIAEITKILYARLHVNKDPPDSAMAATRPLTSKYQLQ